MWLVETWFFFSVLTALCYGFQSVFMKQYASSIDRRIVAWALFCFAVPFYAGFVWYQGIPEVATEYYGAFAVSLAVNLVAWPLFVRAVQMEDVSLVMPLLAFTPVCIFFVEYLILGNTPNRKGVLGILLVVGGTYLLNFSMDGGEDRRIWDPLVSLFDRTGCIYMLIVSMIWSISATVEKITVRASSPSFYLLCISISFTILFFPFLLQTDKKPVSLIRNAFWTFLGLGILTAGMSIFQMIAIRETELVNYVITIKRSGMIVSVLFGGMLFQEENMGMRLIGSAIMVGGVTLL